MAVKSPTGHDLSTYFATIGRKGGQVTMAKKTKAERVEQARRAIQTRWAKAKKAKKESR